MKVVLVSSLFSPFQLETARAVMRIPGVRYEVLFSLAFREARGRHWQRGDFTDLAGAYASVPEGTSPAQARHWLLEEIERRKPDVLISQGLHGPHYEATVRHVRRVGVPWGIWLEQPDPRRSWMRRRAVRAVAWWRLRKARFALGIGDRADAYYGSLNRNHALVPYGQDLSACFAIPARSGTGVARFLYSGQLLPRQNIELIMAAAREVVRRRGPVFRLVIAAHGPEQGAIDRALDAEPRLREVIEYDRDYEKWSDRLRPFARSDVLIYPSLHSGWGLVIPEAMASGCKVITTPQVEAARYFIRDGENGVMIEPTLPGLVREWERCLDRRAETVEMGERARASARRGDAPAVAAQLVEALRRFV